ncbi:transporter substrate-binding domain-containing protein [Silvanigrella sp.]|jgi:hypothetical protein|uniref:transporter substrate-binding domain-containing protein n=1 Tax=Silvanigrella sp. TaxID=2024976 RepID=UPI0037C6B0ED|nr:transporter substrate-binding domain-containing protein [Silvanigrellaceae bacterium]
MSVIHKKTLYSKIVHFISLFFICSNVHAIDKISIKACVDDKPLFPMAMFDKNKMTGIKFDLINLAIEKLKKNRLLDIDLKIEQSPWKRCFEDIRNGKLDLIILAAYTKEREEILDYPEGANHEKEPCSCKLMAICDGYTVITTKNNPFEYKGDPKLIPRPIRVSLGYSVSDHLKELNIPFENSFDSDKAVQKLLSDGEGCVLGNLHYAEFSVNFNKEFHNLLKYSKKPFLFRSYYYPISKKSKLTEEQKKLIWKTIAEPVNNPKAMRKILEKYRK